METGLWEGGRKQRDARMTIPHAKPSDRLQLSRGDAPAGGGPKLQVPRFPSAQILGAGGEAEIEHDGHVYRLRRTSRGGLVLTK